MTSFRTLPTPKPGVTRMEFDYYFRGTDEEFEEYFKFVRQVAIEDYELCEKAQKNLEMGIYTEGILNPVKENGVVGYQGRVRELVREQFDLEKAQAAAAAVAPNSGGGMMDETSSHVNVTGSSIAVTN